MRLTRWDHTRAERFWSKVEKTATCWLWRGTTTKAGYGQLRDRGRVYAHRYVLGLVGRPVPANAVVMHSCDTPACVNPDHLSIGTHADNVADMVAKGRHRAVSLDTHCRAGHELTRENTGSYRDAAGVTHRRCLTCHRAGVQRSRAKASDPHAFPGSTV